MKEKGGKFWRNTILTITASAAVVAGGAVMINNYFGNAATTYGLSDNLKVQSIDVLTPSWRSKGVKSSGGVDYDKLTGHKVNLGVDSNGNEITWWVAARRTALEHDGSTTTFKYNKDEMASAPYMTLLATQPVLKDQIFNTYEDNMPNGKGDYNKTSGSADQVPIYPNHWVMSSIRVYFNRNQGGFPGTYSTRTGKKDGISGNTLSDFENQYLTEKITQSIEPINGNIDAKVNMAARDGRWANFRDRYIVPSICYGKDNTGTDTNNMSYNPAYITWHAVTAEAHGVGSQGAYLIPTEYMPKNAEVWLKSPAIGADASADKKSTYWNGSAVKDANVSLHKGYLPLMTYNLNKNDGVKFVTQEGPRVIDKKKELGIAKNVSASSEGPYYLKYSDDLSAPKASIKSGSEGIEVVSSKFKLRYMSYIPDTSYVVLYLTNRTTGKTFLSVSKIDINIDGIANLNLENVPAGEYAAMAWIEREKDGLEYICTNPKEFTLYRGHDVLFKTSGQVKFLNQSGDEITEITTKDDGDYVIDAVPDNIPYRFIVEVDASCDKSVLSQSCGVDGTPGLDPTSKVKYSIWGNSGDIEGLTAIGVYKENPGKKPSAEPLDPTDIDYAEARKTYWVYKLRNDQTNMSDKADNSSDIKIEVDKLDTNKYKVMLAKEFAEKPTVDPKARYGFTANFSSSGLTGNGEDYRGMKGFPFDHGTYATFGLELSPEYASQNSQIQVRAINADWIEDSPDSTSNPPRVFQHIGKDYIETYKAKVPPLQLANGQYTTEPVQNDLIIWIDNIELVKYNVMFDIDKDEAINTDGIESLRGAVEDFKAKVTSSETTKSEDGSLAHEKFKTYTTPGEDLVTKLWKIEKCEHGSKMELRLKLKPGYVADVDGVDKLTIPWEAAEDGIVELTKQSDGYYQTEQPLTITTSNTIKIQGIKNAKNTIKFKEPIPTGISLLTDLNSNSPIYDSGKTGADKGPKDATLKYNNVYEFKISFDEAHNKSYKDIALEDIELTIGSNSGTEVTFTPLEETTNNKITSKVEKNDSEKSCTVTIGTKIIKGTDYELAGIKAANLTISIKIKDSKIKINEYDVIFSTTSNTLKMYNATGSGATDGNGDFTTFNRGSEILRSTNENLKDIENARESTLTHNTTKYYWIEVDSDTGTDDATILVNPETKDSDGNTVQTFVKVKEIERGDGGKASIYRLRGIKEDTNIRISFGEVYINFKAADADVKLSDAIDIKVKRQQGTEDLEETFNYKNPFGMAVQKNKRLNISLSFKGHEAYTQSATAFAGCKSPGGIGNLKIKMYDEYNNTKYLTPRFENNEIYWDFDITDSAVIIIEGVDLNRYKVILPTNPEISEESLTYRRTNSESTEPEYKGEGEKSIPVQFTNIKHGVETIDIDVNTTYGKKFTHDEDLIFKATDTDGNEWPEKSDNENPSEIFTFKETSNSKTSKTLKLTNLQSDITLKYTVNGKDSGLNEGDIVTSNEHTVTINIPTDEIQIISRSGHEIKKDEVSSTPSNNIYTTQVIEGQTLSFEFASEGGAYNLSDLIVTQVASASTDPNKDKQYMTPASGGVYTTREIVEPLTVDVTPPAYNSYAVTFVMEDSSIKLNDAVSIQQRDKGSLNSTDIAGQSVSVKHGDNLEFKIEAKGRYNKSAPIAKVVKNGVEALLREEYDSNGGYYYFTLDAVTEKTEVIISQITLNKYEVLFGGDNVSFYDDNNKNIDESGMIVEHGSSFPFTIIPGAGYDISTVTIELRRYNSEDADTSGAYITTINKDTGRYSLNEVVNDMTVYVSEIKQQSYRVTFEERGDLINNGDKKFTITATKQTESADIEDINIDQNNSFEMGYAQVAQVTIKLTEKYDKSNITLKLSNENLGRIEEISSDNGSFEYSIYVTGDVYVYIENLAINNHIIKFERADDDMTTELYHDTQDILLNLSETVSVPYGSSYSFRLKASEGYNLQTSNVKAKYIPYDEVSFVENEIVHTESGAYYKYTINAVNRDTTISINPLDKMVYNLKLEGNYVKFLNEQNNEEIADNMVAKEYGEDFTFRIQAEDGYNFDSITADSIKSNAGNIIDVTDVPEAEKPTKQIVVRNIKSDTTIIVNDVKPNEYDVTFKLDPENNKFSISDAMTIFDDSGNNVTPGDSSAIPAKAIHNDDFKFKLDLKEAYNACKDNMSVIVEATGETLSLSDDGYYTVKDVSGAIAIKIGNVKINTYSITFTGEGAVVKTNGEPITEIYGFNGDGAAGSYGMKSDAPTIEHYINGNQGSQYQFRLYADGDRGFKLDTNTLKLSASNGTVEYSSTDSNGEYIVYNVSNVTGSTVINVEGIKSEFYKLEFVGDSSLGEKTGFNIISNGKDVTSGIYLTYDDSIDFEVRLQDGYSNSIVSLAISDAENNDSKLDSSSGYTFKQGSKDTVIKITGLKINEYTIFLSQNESDSINYKSASDEALTVGTQDRKIHHDVGQQTAEDDPRKYTFKVYAENGYDVSNAEIIVENAVANITSRSDTQLTVELSKATGEVTVKVGNVGLHLYTVLFSAYDGEQSMLDNITITSGSGRDITQGMNAPYGQLIRFTVSLHEGYTNSVINVKSGDVAISEESGVYIIQAMPNKDVKIQIDGVTKNKYNLKLEPNQTDETMAQVEFYSGLNGNTSLKVEEVIPDIIHGSEYTFRVKAKKGYTAQGINVVAYNADVNLTYDSNNNCMQVRLSDIMGPVADDGIKNDTTVKVVISGVKKNKYTVKFEGDEASANTFSILADVYKDEYSESLEGAAFRNVTNTGQEVPYNGAVIFKIKPNVGYDRVFRIDPNNAQYKVTATVGDKVLEWHVGESATSYTEGYIITDAILDDTTVKISGITKNNYDISFEGKNVIYCNPVSDTDVFNSKTIEHGGYFRFKVRPETGYDLSDIVIENTTGELTEESKSSSEAVYTLSNITNDGKVTVTINKSRLDLNFEGGEGFKYQKEDGVTEIRGIEVVDYGTVYSFIVRVENGYDPKSLKVYQGDDQLTPIEGGTGSTESNVVKFTTVAIKSDTVIKAKVDKMKYNIKFQSVDGLSYYENGVEVNNSSLIQAEYGGSFQFSIKLDGKHNQSSITVRANGVEISLINGVYTVADISDNIDITVEGVEINKYKINLSSGVGVMYNVISGGETITQGSGVHVREYGGSISFSISPTEGYETSNIVVTVKDEDGTTKSLNASGGVYTISNITGNKTVVAEEASKIQYNIKLTQTPGVTYMNEGGVVIQGNIGVAHGNNFEFTISLNEAYDESVPVVVSTGRTGVTKLETGRYMISNVTEDITITVNNVVKNTYTVTLTAITGVYYKDTAGKIISGAQTVGYNENFSFGVGLHNAYTDSEISVMVGNEAISLEDDGFYRITGILENKTVTVIGVEENIEVDLINTINGLPDTIRNAADVSAVVSATRTYNELPEEKQANVSNIGKLQDLQQQSGVFAHTTNDITVSGVDWNIKLIAVPLSSSTGEHERIYSKLDKEFILSLYDIYLWDMLTDKKYELPEGQKVVVTIPTPDLTYFENPFIIHERSSDGKLEYLLMTRDGKNTHFEMTSFSPVGMAATKTLNTGYSSLYEGLGSGMNSLREGIYDILQTGVKRKNSGSNTGSNGNKPGTGNNQGTSNEPSINEITDNISNGTFAQGNSNSKGSALRLLIVMTLGFIITGIVAFIVKRNNDNESK